MSRRIWMHSWLLNKEQNRAAFNLIMSDAEYRRRLETIEAYLQYHDAQIKHWEEQLTELERDPKYDPPWQELERELGRELTSYELDGKVPLGWDGTKEEFKEWERNEQQRRTNHEH